MCTFLQPPEEGAGASSQLGRTGHMSAPLPTFPEEPSRSRQCSTPRPVHSEQRRRAGFPPPSTPPRRPRLPLTGEERAPELLVSRGLQPRPPGLLQLPHRSLTRVAPQTSPPPWRSAPGTRANPLPRLQRIPLLSGSPKTLQKGGSWRSPSKQASSARRSRPRTLRADLRRSGRGSRGRMPRIRNQCRR